MPLCICTTQDERLVSGPMEDALRQALGERGRALLLVPDFRLQLDACRELAERPGLGLGVTVTTPSAWVRARWEVWGDGTQVADAQQRSLAAHAVLAEGEVAPALDDNPGTARVIADLGRKALPWVPLAADGGIERGRLAEAGLCEEEASLVGYVAAYGRYLEGRGLIEESVAASRIIGRMWEAGATGGLCPVVLAGFGRLDRVRRQLVCDLAAVTDVTVVARAGNEVATAVRDGSLRQVADACAGRGIPVERREDAGRVGSAGAVRAPELVGVLSNVFAGGEGRVRAAGAVSLLEPAGPVAEAEATAREVVRLAHAGARDLVVSAPDAGRAWRELAPKLAARGVSVRAELAECFPDIEAGRAFLEFAEGVAALSELAASWPEPEIEEEQTPQGTTRMVTYVQLGDMSWWPPRGIVDFLLSGIAHVEPSKAYRLDRNWRGNRLLTPTAVLETLQNPAQTSPEVSAATRELLRGHLGSSASRLLAPYAQGQDAEDASDALNRAREVGALEAVMAVGRSLRALGLTSEPDRAGSVSLAELVRRGEWALAETSVMLRPQIEVPGATACVRILPPQRVAVLPAASADAVVLLGQTSVESPVGTGDDVTSALLEELGLEPAADPLGEARATFWAELAVAREHVTAERCLLDESSKETYPSVMLSELLACYGDDGSGGHTPQALGLATSTLPETEACRNLAATGEHAAQVGDDAPCPAGVISGEAARYVVVPRNGDPDLPDGRPILSPTQIETYLACPYKWFSLRRLKLEDSDSGFEAFQRGLFAHRVLEVTHRELLEEALLACADRGEPVPDPELAPEARIPGSRVSADDPALLAHAKELLEAEFDLHERHQHIPRKAFDQKSALVAHTSFDRGALRRLRRDLLSVLDYEAGMFVGYEPRFFEWDFGNHDLVPYAGAWLRGTVDRIDVDAHGSAIVIDYKHRKGTAAEYGALPAEDEEFELPRHVQSLMYGQVIRRKYPGLKVRGAVYLLTEGTEHTISGAVDADQLERVYGGRPPRGKKALQAVSVDPGADFGVEARGMDGLLDATEEGIAAVIGEMLDGNIEANPKDSYACAWCPVLNCEKRMRK